MIMADAKTMAMKLLVISGQYCKDFLGKWDYYPHLLLLEKLYFKTTKIIKMFDTELCLIN